MQQMEQVNRKKRQKKKARSKKTDRPKQINREIKIAQKNRGGRFGKSVGRRKK